MSAELDQETGIEYWDRDKVMAYLDVKERTLQRLHSSGKLVAQYRRRPGGGEKAWYPATVVKLYKARRDAGETDNAIDIGASMPARVAPASVAVSGIPSDSTNLLQKHNLNGSGVAALSRVSDAPSSLPVRAQDAPPVLPVGSSALGFSFGFADDQLTDIIEAISETPANLRQKSFLKLSEAAKISGLSIDNLRSAIRTKQLKYIELGRGFKVRPCDLDEFVGQLFAHPEMAKEWKGLKKSKKSKLPAEDLDQAFDRDLNE